MFYEYSITYPPKTPIEFEKVDTLRLTRGIVKRVEIVFPRGCAGLVGVRIFREFTQVIPVNYPGWVNTDDETVKIDSDIDLTVNPFELEVRGYNLDDTYKHTIRFRFEILLPETEFSIPSVTEESESIIKELEL